MVARFPKLIAPWPNGTQPRKRMPPLRIAVSLIERTTHLQGVGTFSSTPDEWILGNKKAALSGGFMRTH